MSSRSSQFIGNDSGFVNERKLTSTKSPYGVNKVKQFWQQKAALALLEERRSQMVKIGEQSRGKFSFPKWRSNDALSASLVATANTTDLIPTDSLIPYRQITSLSETEKKAEIDKAILQLPYIIDSLRRHRKELERIRHALSKNNNNL